MINPFSAEAKNRRRCLRQQATQSEKKLWKWLRNNQTGYKFKRQYSINTYIVDFYCDEVKLIVELDGITHGSDEQQTYDMQRQKQLEKEGYCVIRYTDWFVAYQIESVVQDIINTCDALEEKQRITTTGVS